MSSGLRHEPEIGPGPPDSRRRTLWLIAAAVVVVLIGIGVFIATRPGSDDSSDAARTPAPAPSASAQASSTPAAADGTRTAVFVGTDAPTAQAYEQWLGKKLDYIVDFSSRANWDEIADPAHNLRQWQGTGYRTVYATAMLPEEDDSVSIEQGAKGEYDKYFRELAQNLVAAGQANSILRLGWEFNLDSSSWQSDSPKAWITYWRRIVTTMKAVPGAQFQFDWNLNNGDNTYDAADYYPGDDVVDYIGVDAYDASYEDNTYPYPDGCDDSCHLKRQMNAWNTSVYGGSRGLRYWSHFAKQHDKPLSLPEWGLWVRDDGHGGGDDIYYLKQMHGFIADRNNNVAYQSYFEYDGDDGLHRLTNDDFPGAGAEFKRLFADS